MQHQANECGHFVQTFQFTASCEDGHIRTLILAPLICESCRIMREAHGMSVPSGSQTVDFEVCSDYSGQEPEWREKLLQMDAAFRQKLHDNLVTSWPESPAHLRALESNLRL